MIWTLKDVERLGKVPEHWNIRKATWLFAIGSGTTPPSGNSAYYDGDIPWVTTSELRETVIVITEKTVTDKALRDLPSLRLHPKGSVAVAMYGATIGRLGIFGVDATVNQACCVFSKPKGIEASFWFYWLQMRRPYLISLGYGGGQPNLSQELLRGVRVPTPPKDEQRAIVNMLDRETARIDTLVAKKERLIKLLQEKRTALITYAVTKGLDPNVPMKDSGVEWLGAIPAHWDVKPVGAVADSLVGFPFPSEDFSLEEGTRLVRGDNVTTEALRWSDKTRAWNRPIPHHRYLLRGEDIVVGMDGSKVGRNYALVPEHDLPLLLVQRVTRLRARSIVFPDFLFWSIAGPRFHAHVDTRRSDPAIPHITLKDIEAYPIALPPLREQENILRNIRFARGRLDALLGKVREAIDSLSELRSALISAAVTGKIDVREEEVT
jgi:type I restriction enzyme, S subunit